MRIAHLTASTFFGGPERQMLGLAEALRPDIASFFLLFPEGNRFRAFANEIESRHFLAVGLESDFPRIRASLDELTSRLASLQAQLLITHGYKSNVLGRIAARRLGIPIVSVSRGWTGENWKVHLYETADRCNLRWMDHVVCVSNGQARKVRKAGVPRSRLSVIRNASRLNAFDQIDPSYRKTLQEILGGHPTEGPIVMAAGRLSPEKGFDLFIEAASKLIAEFPQSQFVIFGEGVLRAELQAKIDSLQLTNRFILAGFRSDLDRFFPWVDLVVSSSHTEGLPNVLLEAAAAKRPIVATAVGGTPEVVDSNCTGILVPPGSADALAKAIRPLLADAQLRAQFGAAGRAKMEREFSFEAQAKAYRRLFECLLTSVS